MQAARGDYTKVIAAEYAFAVVLLGAAPLVPNPAKSDHGAVRVVEPLARFTALWIVFLVLSLLSSGRSTGRIAAAFGGLVLLGVAYSARNTITGAAALLSSATGTQPSNLTSQQYAQLFDQGPGQRYNPPSGG